MENKINTVFLVEYSKDLSKRLIESKLQDKAYITGKEIVEFSPIPQVNFFVLRNLFEKWQEEREKLRVPFFDYADPEVKKAMRVYLNTLSHHIKLNSESFQKLLESAIFDTLELVLSPFKFIKGKIINVKDGKVEKSAIKEVLKYFKFNKVVLDDLLAEIDKFPHNEVNSEDLFDTLHEIIQRDETKLIAPKEVISKFNEVKFISIDEVILDYTEEKERTIIPAPEKEVKVEPLMEETTEEIPQKIEETEIEESEGNNSSSGEIEFTFEAPGPDQQNTLNDQFKTEEESKLLHETITSQNSGSELFDLLNLNERFMFAKELFGDNQETLKEASNQLKDFESYEEARLFLIEKYADENDWFDKEEIESKFFNKVSGLY